MLKKKRARNLRSRDGETEYVVTETRQRNRAKRGRKTKSKIGGQANFDNKRITELIKISSKYLN